MNDAQTSYMVNAEPYVGKITTNNSVPEYYVKNLSESIHGSERCITADNWFMSVPLAMKMRDDYSLSVVGTIRKNKPEVPLSFIRCASAMTSRFAFSNNMTLVSYCPKKNKVVLLISTLHKNGKINSETGKPEIVMHYNKTKEGTDTFDQLAKMYTTARISNRWTMRLFYV